MWDTQGMEHVHSVPNQQIKKADAIVLLFDVTEKQTFTALKDWLAKISEIKRSHVPVFIVGNKCDDK